MNDLEQQKRELIARSAVQRQELADDLRQLQHATAWIQKSLDVLRATSPLLLAAAPVAGLVVGRRWLAQTNGTPKRAPEKKGLVAKAMTGWHMYRRVRPVLQFVRRLNRPPESRHYANH